MNYKQQLSLLGGLGTTLLGTYLGFKYTVFQGKLTLLLMGFVSRYWSQSNQVQQIDWSWQYRVQGRLSFDASLVRKTHHL